MRVTLALNGLNETFYRQMTTIMTFFLQISALFSNFCKIAGENSPSPYSYASAFILPQQFEHCFETGRKNTVLIS